MIYMWISWYHVDRYIYMLCIPWCILNPFITVVVTPFIPPFHNNHPFHELIAGSEISSVLLVIRGRLGSLANEHPAGPSPPKILKTSTRGCWSIWEVHPVKNHFFRRYVVSFFWGGVGCPNKNLLPSVFQTWNQKKLLHHGWLLRGPLKHETKYVIHMFSHRRLMLDVGNVNKPSEVKARVLAIKIRTALEVKHFEWSLFARFVLLQNLRLGHFSG